MKKQFNNANDFAIYFENNFKHKYKFKLFGYTNNFDFFQLHHYNIVKIDFESIAYDFLFLNTEQDHLGIESIQDISIYYNKHTRYIEILFTCQNNIYFKLIITIE